MLELNSIKIKMKDSKARSFVAIMIVIAVASLLLRFGIEQLIRLNISRNESIAQATLKIMSTALENYAKDNRGAYPGNLAVLTKSVPAYLGKDYLDPFSLKGYNYSCSRMEPSGYNCQAEPIKCNLSGKTSFAVTTGGSLATQECSKEE